MEVLETLTKDQFLDSGAEEAFQQLKRMLTSAPTLSFLSEGDLILDTDASGTAIEAVL